MSDTTETTPSRDAAAGPITQFAIKTCIVAVIISACTVFVADWIMDSAERSIARSLNAARAELNSVREELQKSPIGGPQFWSKIERQLDQAADPASDLPAEKKQKIINDLRVIVSRWRPLVEAVTTEKAQKPAP